MISFSSRLIYDNSIYTEAELPVSGLSRHLGLRLLSGRQFVLLIIAIFFLMCYASLLSGGTVLCDNLHAGTADKDLYSTS